MRFRALLRTHGSSREIEFDYGYDARDLVEAEAKRLARPDETVDEVSRIFTPEEEERARELRKAARLSGARTDTIERGDD